MKKGLWEGLLCLISHSTNNLTIRTQSNNIWSKPHIWGSENRNKKTSNRIGKQLMTGLFTSPIKIVYTTRLMNLTFRKVLFRFMIERKLKKLKFFYKINFKMEKIRLLSAIQTARPITSTRTNWHTTTSKVNFVPPLFLKLNSITPIFRRQWPFSCQLHWLKTLFNQNLTVFGSSSMINLDQ